jgi:hypothetical protein
MIAVVRVVQEGESVAREHTCCLDTGSDVNISVRHLLHEVRKIEKESVSTCGDETEFAEEGILYLFVSGTIRKVPALVAVTPKIQLPFGRDVLLGVPGVDDLGVRLDDHRAAKPKKLQCHVGEKTLRTWLEVNGTQEVTKASFDVDEVLVSPDLPEAMQLKVRRLLAKFQDVFAGEQNSLIPQTFRCCSGGIEVCRGPSTTKHSGTALDLCAEADSHIMGRRGVKEQVFGTVYLALGVPPAYSNEDASARP